MNNWNKYKELEEQYKQLNNPDDKELIKHIKRRKNINTVYEYLKAGKNVSETSQEMDISRRTIYNYINEFDWEKELNIKKW